MSTSPRSNRNWVQRVRSTHDRRVRQRERVCYIEGIRQVLAAYEGGVDFEAVLIDSSRLKSERAWLFIEELRLNDVEVVTLRPVEFERMSGRDKPIGLSAIVRWGPEELHASTPNRDSLYLAADDIRDPGNLGTLIRTVDALGAAGIVLHGGTDAGHPTAIRASLGTLFHTPVYQAASLNELFHWANANGVMTVATSASAANDLTTTQVQIPSLVLVGNEGNGLGGKTIERCDLAVQIPQAGTATSLNVSVAAGIVLFEILRRLH